MGAADWRLPPLPLLRFRARGLASTLTRSLEDVAFDQFGTEQGSTVRVRMIAGALDVAIEEPGPDRGTD